VVVVNLGEKPGAGGQRRGNTAKNEQSSAKKKVQTTPAKKKPAQAKTARASSVRKKGTSGHAGETRGSAKKRPGTSRSGATASASSSKVRATRGAAREKTAGRGSRRSSEQREGIPCEAAACGDAVESASQQIRMELAKKKVKGSLPAIVEKMIEKAKGGSYSHAKALLEMTGALQMFDDEPHAKSEGESWAKRVLERIQEAEQMEMQKALPSEAATGPQS
jgi:hypothetical protein